MHPMKKIKLGPTLLLQSTDGSDSGEQQEISNDNEMDDGSFVFDNSIDYNNDDSNTPWAKKIKTEKVSNEQSTVKLSASREKQQVSTKQIRQQQMLRERIRKEKQAMASMDLPQQPLVQTIGGGTSVIFEMARRMTFWEQQQEQLTNNNNNDIGTPQTTIVSSSVPRWHPTSGIVSDNPNFRTKPPIMNNQGYAGTIWRNLRKRNKPAMWRYALRTFDRMLEQKKQNKSLITSVRVRPTNIHYEGALLACAKLGLSDRALDIYKQVEADLAKVSSTRKVNTVTSSTRSGRSVGKSPKYNKISTDNIVQVTDNMIMSVIKSCVRASKQRTKTINEAGKSHTVELSIQERRIPLDAAVHIVQQMESKYDIPICAVHINPLARAYQHLGLLKDGNELINNHLKDRISGPESESTSEKNRLNIYDVQAKDKGSYCLLIQSAVSDADWGTAIDALRDMTEAGLYPADRHVNAWTGISKRNKKTSEMAATAAATTTTTRTQQ